MREQSLPTIVQPSMEWLAVKTQKSGSAIAPFYPGRTIDPGTEFKVLPG
jgi:hypothetical protein